MALMKQGKMKHKAAPSAAGAAKNFRDKPQQAKHFAALENAAAPRRGARLVSEGSAGEREFGGRGRFAAAPGAGRKNDRGEPGGYRERADGGGAHALPRAAKRPARRDEPGDKTERIAKRLARAGIASRREAETMIAAGRIAVNGRVLAAPAFNVGPEDKITVDGAALPSKERTRLWLYHKPAGLITSTRDERGRATIFDSLPAALPRVVSVGRLDRNTEGLLLLTNDGGLARILELPSTGWVRHYRVRAHGKVSREQLESLKTGIAVDGVFYGGAEAALEREQGSNAWLSVSLREGKNHEVKNILGALGLAVTRLIRTSFGPFRLGDLPAGAVLEVRGRALRDQLGEKLAEEAGLDFSAPIITPFPNAAVAARPLRASRSAGGDNSGFDRKAAEPDAAAEGGWISSSAPGRRVMRAAEAAPMPRRAMRNANVWHASGSKLRGVRQEAQREERDERRGREDRGGRRAAGESDGRSFGAAGVSGCGRAGFSGRPGGGGSGKDGRGRKPGGGNQERGVFRSESGGGDSFRRRPGAGKFDGADKGGRRKFDGERRFGAERGGRPEFAAKPKRFKPRGG